MTGNPSAWAESPKTTDGTLRPDEGAPTPLPHVAPAEQREGADIGEPRVPAKLPFELNDLGRLRRLVADAAAGAALEPTRCDDLVLAVDELATNSICHGGGSGTLEIWRERGRLVCEVSDSGVIAERVHGRPMPDPNAVSGRGLWLVEQLTDRVEVCSAPGVGSIVRVSMQLT
jgi:anti-sigma regulatory factor (Ser/Thr protein kinase)